MIDGAVLETLVLAGWAEDRATDTSRYREMLINDGFLYWPELDAFLRSFGGLHLHFARYGSPDDAYFDPSRVLLILDPDGTPRYRGAWEGWRQQYETRAEVSLAPIGSAHGEHLTLWKGVDDNWYGSFDATFGLIGVSDIDMICHLFDEPGRLIREL